MELKKVQHRVATQKRQIKVLRDKLGKCTDDRLNLSQLMRILSDQLDVAMRQNRAVTAERDGLITLSRRAERMIELLNVVLGIRSQRDVAIDGSTTGIELELNTGAVSVGMVGNAIVRAACRMRDALAAQSEQRALYERSANESAGLERDAKRRLVDAQAQLADLQRNLAAARATIEREGKAVELDVIVATRRLESITTVLNAIPR